MNTCIICQTKQSAQTSICRTCGFPLRPPKFLSEIQYESWMSEEITPRRRQWHTSQKQEEVHEHTVQEIEALKKELSELKRTVAELQKQLQTFWLQAQVGGILDDQINNQKIIQSLSIEEVLQRLQLPPQQADYTVPNGITQIDAFAFSDSDLKAVFLPDSVRTIGDHAFSKCKKLKQIHLPDSLISISSWAFYGCTALHKIHLPDPLIKIGDSAFRNCTNLTQIHLSNSLISISPWTFYGCTSLQEIYLPDSLTKIGKYAFYNVNATVYYPASCAGKDWVGQNYGGKLVWKPY